MTHRDLKLMFVVASRPNFMKIAPLIKEAKKQKIKHSIFFTEQHRSEFMTGIIAKDLDIPRANYSLNLKKRVKRPSKLRKGLAFINSFVYARGIMKYDKPSIVVVVGDVISSAYMTIIARSLSIPVAHVEAGLRSFNREMPEEKSRKFIDKCSKYLFTHEESANRNLLREGKSKNKIKFVGNVMIDSLKNHILEAKKNNYYKKLKLKKGKYSVLTFHRHENTKRKNRLIILMKMLKEITKTISVVYPIHPAALRKFKAFGILEEMKKIKNLKIVKPVGYKEMLNLTINSKFIMTDSGGLQEETTFLGVPCLTLRMETERPITETMGTNTVVGFNIDKTFKIIDEILSNRYKKGKIPPLWDGKTSKRIIEILKNENNFN